MTPSDDDAAFADPVADALTHGADVLHKVAASDHVDDDLGDEAKRALREIIAQGAYAWSAQQREDLDTVARSLGRALNRAGRAINPDETRLRPFEGRNPSFAPMAADELVKAVRDENLIVGRRLIAPSAGTPIPEKDLAGAQILDCAFVDWSFDDVDLSRSRLVHTVFQRCSFDGADLTDASATTCMFDGATADGPGSFRVTAPRINLSASYLGSYDIRGADLSEAALSYGYLWSLKGDGATNLERANFDMATLDHVVAHDARLTGAFFVGATLTNVDLRGAELTEAVFSSAKIAGARLESATLDGAAFRTAYFVGLARYDDAILRADLTDEDRAAIEERLSQDGNTADVDLHGDERPE